MRKEKSPSYRAAIYIGAVILALSLVFYFSILPLMRKKADFRSRLTEIEGEITAEQGHHRELHRERRNLEEQDPSYLEKYARDNFGWAREGEIIYKLEKEK